MALGQSHQAATRSRRAHGAEAVRAGGQGSGLAERPRPPGLRPVHSWCAGTCPPRVWMTMGGAFESAPPSPSQLVAATVGLQRSRPSRAPGEQPRAPSRSRSGLAAIPDLVPCSGSGGAAINNRGRAGTRDADSKSPLQLAPDARPPHLGFGLLVANQRGRRCTHNPCLTSHLRSRLA